MIFLPRGVPVRQNVNPARINIPEAMEKLRVGNFTGYLRFDASQGSGIIIFTRGKLVSALFIHAEGAERLIAYDAISKVFEVSILGDAILNIYRLEPELASALHAMLHGKCIYKEQELKLVNVQALLDKVKAEQFNGCLRVYAEEKTTLIFYDSGSALGFFHDGTAGLQVTADLSKSVARLPGAKIDMLETGSIDGLVLADLMASADLGPIWQRLRKALLQDRSLQEEQAIRSRQEQQEQRRRQVLSDLKTIAGKYTGKFGISQVEKAFTAVGPEMRKEEISGFFTAMERLAAMVAKPEKVSQMLDEMRKVFE